MGAFEQITKISLKKKILVLTAMIGVFGFAFWFFYYSPVQTEYSDLLDTYERLRHDKQDAVRRKAAYDKDRKRRDDLKQAYGQQLRALPSEAEMSSFLNSLNTQAELVGLEILSVKPKKEEPSKYYARIPVELKLTGSFHQLAKFFYLVGNLDRIINIENISLKIKEFGESSAVLSADVLATTFRAVAESNSTDEKPGKGKKKKSGS
jgi:type IV pilus assembly protein PilO